METDAAGKQPPMGDLVMTLDGGHDDHGQWDYERGDYERAKHEATLAACGDGPFSNALDLGGSIGVFTEMLAPRCKALATVDVARTAAAMTRRRLADFPQVRVIYGAVPGAVPDQRFDLIVAAEILYHLSTEDLEHTLRLIRAQLVTGGRLVAVHWRPPDPERLVAVGELHTRLRNDPWLSPLHRDEAGMYLLDALERI
jgi:cyclopropane fatty-acyl-phospholipid synthase-like methyltransferase